VIGIVRVIRQAARVAAVRPNTCQGPEANRAVLKKVTARSNNNVRRTFRFPVKSMRVD